MAASHTERPVTITISAAWTFHLDPRPHPPHDLLVANIIRFVASVARLIFGVAYYSDCPQEPNIPNFLIGLALIGILLVMYESTPRTQTPPTLFKACLTFLVALSVCIWDLAGIVRVFAAYQPNYDPRAANGLYCNKTLYTFAFWSALWEAYAFVVILGRMCKGLLLGVTVMPAPTNRDIYGRV